MNILLRIILFSLLCIAETSLINAGSAEKTPETSRKRTREERENNENNGNNDSESEALEPSTKTQVPEECAICLNNIDITDTTSPLSTLTCKHIFHSECVDQWVAEHRTCPICRKVQPTKHNDILEAVLDENLAAVTLLLNNDADIEAHNEHGDTSLHIAAIMGYTEIVTLLLDRGADIESQNDDGDTPLQAAALNGQAEVVALLLDRGANIEARNNDGSTPLQVAALNRQTEIITLLLDRGADINAQDNDDETALNNAENREYDEIVTLLQNRQNQVAENS